MLKDCRQNRCGIKNCSSVKTAGAGPKKNLSWPTWTVAQKRGIMLLNGFFADDLADIPKQGRNKQLILKASADKSIHNLSARCGENAILFYFVSKPVTCMTDFAGALTVPHAPCDSIRAF